MSTTNFHAFIEKLKDDVFRTQLAPILSNLQEGDWAAISHLASKYGFQFTVAEMKAEMKHYSGFFKGSGHLPDDGWAPSTLLDS